MVTKQQSSVVRITIDSDKMFNNIDMGWLYRLINMKLGERAISETEQRELTSLRSKLWALDDAITRRR